jgi:hypothetical protein
MDLKVQFPDPAGATDWQEWARRLVETLSRMITPTPQDQYPIVVLKDKRGAGTHGGASVAGWNFRQINYEYDPVGICLLMPDSTFTLVKGRYLLRASAPAYGAGQHQTRLRNLSQGTVEIWGTPEYMLAAGGQTRSWIVGVIEPKSATSYRLEHYIVSPVAVNGLGVAVGQGEEVYSQVELWGLQ